MTQPAIAGIDLGTTYSVIAVVDEHGQPRAVPNTEGELTTPSAVHVNPDGTVVVGQPALAFPDDTARIFKRFMGSQTTFPLAGRAYTAEQLSAEVLRKLVCDASQQVGAPIEQVVISVPAYFGQMERDATRRAGELAGLTVLQMINEPTAAASLYTQQRPLERGHLLIFDLGGGTFDVTLLEVTEAGPYVKRTSGSIHLGGQDFNDLLVNQLTEQYQTAHQREILGEARVALDRQVEAAKIALSTEATATITAAAADGPEMPITLTREEFEEGISGHLMEISAIMDLMLDRANLTPADIQTVLLVGGSSRIPAVRSMLQQTFGRAPDESLNPDLAVALGAAMAAAGFHVGGLATATGALRIMDSVSHAVGVKALEVGRDRYVLDAVLPHGFPLGKWSEARSYRPERAGDSLIGVEIYQGDTTDLTGCTKIGYLPVPLPAGGGPDNTHVQVWMQLNASGLLEVQVAINDAQPQRGEFRL